MALSMTAKIAIAGAAGLALLGLAGGASGGGSQQAGLEPQRTPSVPPAPPATPDGEERSDDEGRTWGTFYVNRDAKKHFELLVFNVASSPSNAAIGTGDVIVNVYITTVASANWEWSGAACKGEQWRLRFASGHLQSSTRMGPVGCQTVRPLEHVMAYALNWVQVGSNVLLVMDTKSGLNKLFPDELSTNKFGGTGAYYDKSSDAEWDNDNVASGYITIDASWVFNPK